LFTSPQVTAAQAGRIMRTYGIRHLPVIRSGHVVGMISDRDVRSAHVGATVGTVMSSPAHVISADDTTEAAARLLLSRRISSLPVLDAQGQLVGMITTTDCLLASLAAAPTG
jgi:CBS domain-containing protein